MAVPCNLITGALGVGKSTAIRHLLQHHRPEGERWAVLVNEVGAVPVDQAALSVDDNVVVAELPGGCLCCTLGAPFDRTLERLLRRERPDRLLIEPTGLGHPARVLQTLREGRAARSIRLGATITLVDPRQWRSGELADHPAWWDQIELADVLVANKADLAPSGDVAAFMGWAADLFPPKSRVEITRNGRLNPEWLSLPCDAGRSPLFPDAHQAAGKDYVQSGAEPVGEGVWRACGRSLGQRSVGWVFAAATVFDRQRLLRTLNELRPAQRLKGVFRTGRDWLLINADRDGVRAEACDWRRDSRLEVIGHEDARALEAALLACRRPREKDPV